MAAQLDDSFNCMDKHSQATFVGPVFQCLLPRYVAKIFEEKICAGVESVSLPFASDVAV